MQPAFSAGHEFQRRAVNECSCDPEFQHTGSDYYRTVFCLSGHEDRRGSRHQPHRISIFRGYELSMRPERRISAHADGVKPDAIRHSLRAAKWSASVIEIVYE